MAQAATMNVATFEDDRYRRSYEARPPTVFPSAYPPDDLYAGLPHPRKAASATTSATTLQAEKKHVVDYSEEDDWDDDDDDFDEEHFDDEDDDSEVCSSSSGQEEEDEEDETYPMPRRRPLLSESEFARQGREYTRNELKQAGLYYKHASHFWRLRARDALSSVRTRVPIVKILVALLVLAVPILLGLYMADEGPFTKTDISMLPDLAQKKAPMNNRGEEQRSLFNRLLRRAGLAGKHDNETLVAAPIPLGTANDKHVEAPKPGGKARDANKANVQAQERVEEGKVNPVGVYEQPSFTFSIIPSMEGMNIFSFAYSAAIDFLSRTFGWETNATVSA